LRGKGVTLKGFGVLPQSLNGNRAENPHRNDKKNNDDLTHIQQL